MSDKAVTERLQPSLLDRLTDDDPTETKEPRDARVIDVKRLREIIQRDLAWLLNTSDNSGLIDEKRYPNIAKSVLNYGIREVAGEHSTVERAELIRQSILRAVQDYEPRIHAGSVAVELRADKDERRSVVSFDIRADMWAQPMPLELYLRSEVDVTTGQLDLQRVN
ncbi:MAG: type VI secretion system baseplate subunit TssE [Pseudomonadota bacterium]